MEKSIVRCYYEGVRVLTQKGENALKEYEKKEKKSRGIHHRKNLFTYLST